MTHDPSVQTGNEVTESVTSGTAPTPSHDPLCQTLSHHHPDAYPCDCHFCQVWCDCEHIAKVRADERGKDDKEDHRRAERDRAAREILDSETFMWLMAGSKYEQQYLQKLRRAYLAYCENLDGGYGRWADRQRNKPWLNNEADRGES